MRNVCLGTLMALCIALLSNLLELSVALNGPNPDKGLKFALIGFFAAGAVSLGLARLVWMSDLGGRIPAGLSWALVVAGVLASGFFIVVVGLNGGGFGPGVAETLGSSLEPCFYLLLIFYLAARWRTDQTKATTPRYTHRISWGALLVFCGLLCLGLSINLNEERNGPPVMRTTLDGAPPCWGLLTNLNEERNEEQNDRPASEPAVKNILLLILGVVGAAGSASSVFLTRLLKKSHSVPVPFLVVCRYSGVAVVYLFAWASGGFSEGLAKESVLLAFLSGAVLIHFLFFFMTEITNDLVTAASLGLAPVLTLAIEFILYTNGCVVSKTPFEAPGVWAGVVVAMVGIALLQSDPASSSVLDDPDRKEGRGSLPKGGPK